MNSAVPVSQRHIHIGNLTVGNDRPLALIAGPCAIESRGHAMEMAHALVEIDQGRQHRVCERRMLRMV